MATRGDCHFSEGPPMKKLVYPFSERSSMAKLVEIYPCAPLTERGRGIHISGNRETRYIVYCSRRSVVLCNLDNPLDGFVYNGHYSQTSVARLSPDGSLVASADLSGFLRIWNRKGDDHPSFKEGYVVSRGQVDEMQWLPDGKALVVCASMRKEYSVRVFYWETCHGIKVLSGPGRVLSCACKPTMPATIVIGGTDSLVKVYRGTPMEPQTHRGHSGSVNCVSYSPDGGKFISVSSDMTGIIYDGNSGDIVGKLSSQGMHIGSIFSVSWSDDNKHVLTVSADNSAKVWEVDDDRGCANLKRTLRVPGSDGMDDMLVGCLWLSNKLVVVSFSGFISIFSANNLDETPMTFSGHKTGISGLSCFPRGDCKVLLSGSKDGTIMRWMQGVGYSGQVNRKYKTEIKCFTAVEGSIMVSGNDNKVIRIHLNSSCDCVDEEVIEVNSQPIDLCIALQSHDHSLVATKSAVSILKGARVLSTTTLDFTVTASAIAPDGNEVIVGDENGHLHIYSVKEFHMFSAGPPLKKHGGPITVVKYSPNGEYFVSSDTLLESIVWKCSSHEVVMENLFYHMEDVTCVAWSPSSRRFATGSIDRNIIIYKVGERYVKRITIVEAHGKGISGLTFTDEDTLVSSGGDGCLCSWQIIK